MINFDFMFDDKKEDYRKILDDLRGGEARLIDIREESEWNQNRFKCAAHIPLSDLSRGIGLEILKEIKQSNKKYIFIADPATGPGRPRIFLPNTSVPILMLYR